jgi:Tfp pilus assembly protein PilF
MAVASGQRQEAGAILASLKSAGVGAHVARAELARADGRAKDAEREIRQAVALDPLSFDALSRLLEISIEQRRPRTAIPSLQRAAQRATGSPRHMALLGEALLAAGDGVGAEAALTRALDLAPDASSVRTDIARARIAQKKWTEAEAALEPAAPSLERSVLLGVACSSLGRFADASTHFETALKMAGGKPTPDLLNGLGWAQHKLGRQAQAADSLRQSLALKRDQPEIRRLLARIEGSAAR